MDSVPNIDDFLAKLIISEFVCEMKIFTDEFLPSGVNPFLFQSSLGINAMIVSQIFDGII